MTPKQNIDIITKSLTKLLVIANNKPKGDEENYRALAKAHVAAGEEWVKQEAIPIATAALALLGGMFSNIERIANSLDGEA
jgi:hypothetical protein